MLKGVFDRRRFLDLVKDFIVFGDTGSDVIKILAGYHQFHAVRLAVSRTLAATAQEGDRKVGVMWHTQGSGKSLLMAFYAGQIIKHPAMENPTLVVLTDRNDLDDQLFGTFSMCKDLLRLSGRPEICSRFCGRRAGHFGALPGIVAISQRRATAGAQRQAGAPAARGTVRRPQALKVGRARRRGRAWRDAHQAGHHLKGE